MFVPGQLGQFSKTDQEHFAELWANLYLQAENEAASALRPSNCTKLVSQPKC